MSRPHFGKIHETAFLVGIVALAMVSGCGAEDPAVTSTGMQPVFIAFERDFQEYHKWRSWTLTDVTDQGMAHTSGPRTVFLNRIPPAKSLVFPVGTIVVKEMGSGPVGDRQTFAIVKRGGDYNQTGAVDWEWFELHNRADSSVEVLWHGSGPPSGESYGGNPAAGGCNECHSLNAKNDFIRSAPLDLTLLK